MQNQKRLHRAGDGPPPARGGHADGGSGGEGPCIGGQLQLASPVAAPTDGTATATTRPRAAYAPLWRPARVARRVISHARTGTPLHSNPWRGDAKRRDHVRMHARGVLPGRYSNERRGIFPRTHTHARTHTRGGHTNFDSARLLTPIGNAIVSNSYIRTTRVWLASRASTLNGGYPQQLNMYDVRV